MYHEPCPNCGREFETQSAWRSHTGGQCTKPETPLVQPRALTLWQPWATLVAKGIKRYETRSWSPAYRGPLLIHAGKGIDRNFTQDLVKRGVLEDDDLPSMTILCAVDLWECHRMPSRIPLIEHFYGDLSDGRWAWELRNLRTLRIPVSVKGQLGLWLPSLATVVRVNARLQLIDGMTPEYTQREWERAALAWPIPEVEDQYEY